MSSFEVFTTLRYQADGSARVRDHHIPLFARHVRRLRDTDAFYASTGKGSAQAAPAGAREGEDWEAAVERVINEAVERARESLSSQEYGCESVDFRVKVSIGSFSSIPLHCEAVPLPLSTPPFYPSIASIPSGPSSKTTLPRILLSPQHIPPAPEDLSTQTLLRKTTSRGIYTYHTSLLPSTSTGSPGYQAPLLHSCEGLITETTFANVLFLPPGETRWRTPRAGRPDVPFLPGLMRAELLERGEIDESDIKIEEARQWVADGGRVACCNALRGVWEVRLDFEEEHE